MELNTLKKTIKQNMRKLIEAEKLPNTQLSQRLGKSPGYINRILNSGNPNLDNMTEIANYFEIPVETLITANSEKSTIRIQIDQELNKFPEERLPYILDLLKNIRKE